MNDSPNQQQKQFHIGLVPDFRVSPPATDGISVYSRQLIAALNEAVSPYRYTIFISQQQRLFLPDLSGQFRLVSLKPSEKNLITDIGWYFFVLPYLTRKHKIDLLHLFAGNRRLSLFPFSKTVVTVHDIYHYYNKQIYTRPRYLFCRYVLSPLLKHYPHILTVSQNSASDLQKMLHIPLERVRVISNGYNNHVYKVLSSHEIPGHIRETYSLERDFLLYVSSFDHPRKNHISLLQAYHHVKNTRHSSLDLVLVGTPFWQATTIYAEIDRLGLGEHVKILRDVPDNDLAGLYNLATMFVHPSRHEGFGIPILEAMACGLPVACSDIPAFREIAFDVALFFDQKNPQDMADKIIRLYENRPLYQQCRQNGLERATHFSWHHTAEKVLDVYQNILLKRENL